MIVRGWWVVTVLVAGLGVAWPARIHAQGSSWAVSPAELRQLQKRPAGARAPVVIDVRSREEYRRGHVPGSIWVDWPALDPTRRARAGLAAELGKLGLTRDDQVVVVGAGRTSYGEEGRLVWLLDWLGQSRVGLLDGGWGKWRGDGGAVESGDGPRPSPARYEVRLRPDARATAEDLRRLARAPGTVILDVRARAEYDGHESFGARRQGRIPGARHLEWTRFLAPDGTLRKDADLERTLQSLGVGRYTNVIVYCSSGVRSGMAYSALKALGRVNAVHYDRSFADWSSRFELPVEK